MAHFICRLATEEGEVKNRSYFAPSALECRRFYEERLAVLGQFVRETAYELGRE